VRTVADGEFGTVAAAVGQAVSTLAVGN